MLNGCRDRYRTYLHRLRIVPTVAALRNGTLPETLPTPALVITGSIRSFDGRSAALSLLNEIPDPLTTVTHGTWVALSPRCAQKYGVADGDQLRLTHGDFHLTLPARLQQGLPDDVFSLPVDCLPARFNGFDPATGEPLRYHGPIRFGGRKGGSHRLRQQGLCFHVAAAW